MDKLTEYLEAIKAGLYELHCRQVVRDEGSQILSGVRTAADQAIEAAGALQSVANVTEAPSDIEATLIGIRDDVATLKAALMGNVTDVATKPAEATVTPVGA